MKLTKIDINLSDYPADFHQLLTDCEIFDSSCSQEARVTFIDKDNGYFLKTAKKDSLRRESQMMAYYHTLGLSAKVRSYLSLDKDWLLTEKIQGQDCTDEKYLADPQKLCQVYAKYLQMLHSQDYTHCPIQNHTELYLNSARSNKQKGNFDPNYLFDTTIPPTPEAVWAYVEANAHKLQTNTLLHGDYCLPNTILNDWEFSGFIDIDRGGVGDKHVDIYWGIWTIGYNLTKDIKTYTFADTNLYRQDFIDAYCKDSNNGTIDTDILRLIGAIETFG